MYNVAFQKLLLPLLDQCNRTKVAQRLRFLRESQWWSTEELRALQDAKLRRLVKRAYAEVPYYRTVFEERGLHPSDIQGRDDLPKLPILTKELVRQHGPDLLSRRIPRSRLIRSKTSGSTGKPMAFYLSREQESWRWASRFRMWTWGGYVPGDRYAYLTCFDRATWRKRLQDLLFRGRYLHSVASEDRIDAYLKRIKRERLGFLVAYVSSAHMLAQRAYRSGEEIHLRGIVTHAETLLPSHRAFIEQAFGSPVFDLYGLGGEGVHIAAECERHDGYHVTMENVIVEVVAGGEPVGPGEMGELIITVLDNEGMPLIRYNTEDIARASNRMCACGRGLQRIESIEGRNVDVVVCPNGLLLTPLFFIDLFPEVPGIHQYQVVQHVPSRILVRLVTNGEFNADVGIPMIRRAIGAATRGQLDVDFEFVSNIPLSSNKRRYVISEVPIDWANP